MYKLKEAKGLMLMMLNFKKWDGVTTYWNTIYIRKGHLNNTTLIKHERIHEEQMKREGKVKYFFKYTWFAITKGYDDNPYEVEAYRDQEK